MARTRLRNSEYLREEKAHRAQGRPKVGWPASQASRHSSATGAVFRFSAGGLPLSTTPQSTPPFPKRCKTIPSPFS